MYGFRDARPARPTTSLFRLPVGEELRTLKSRTSKLFTPPGPGKGGVAATNDAKSSAVVTSLTLPVVTSTVDFALHFFSHLHVAPVASQTTNSGGKSGPGVGNRVMAAPMPSLEAAIKRYDGITKQPGRVWGVLLPTIAMSAHYVDYLFPKLHVQQLPAGSMASRVDLTRLQCHCLLSLSFLGALMPPEMPPPGQFSWSTSQLGALSSKAGAGDGPRRMPVGEYGSLDFSSLMIAPTKYAEAAERLVAQLLYFDAWAELVPVLVSDLLWREKRGFLHLSDDALRIKMGDDNNNLRSSVVERRSRGRETSQKRSSSSSSSASTDSGSSAGTRTGSHHSAASTRTGTASAPGSRSPSSSSSSTAAAAESSADDDDDFVDAAEVDIDSLAARALGAGWSTVTFRRVQVKSHEIPLWAQRGADSVVTDNVAVSSTLRVEDSKAQVHVAFSSKQFMAGALLPSCTQEEVLASVKPELLLGVILVERLLDIDVALVSGAIQYVRYTGFKSHFKVTGAGQKDVDRRWKAFAYQRAFHNRPHADAVLPHIVAMDATVNVNNAQFKHLGRDLHKAYAAFSCLDLVSPEDAIESIATGSWGCDDRFMNDPVLKFIQQLMVISVCPRAKCGQIDYCVPGEPELKVRLEAVRDAMKAADATVADVYQHLKFYGFENGRGRCAALDTYIVTLLKGKAEELHAKKEETDTKGGSREHPRKSSVSLIEGSVNKKPLV